MNNFLDRLQQAWQSQCSRPLDVNPDQLLNTVRREQRVNFWTDIGIVVFFFCLGMYFLDFVLRDIQRNWPFLCTCASLAWVVVYILFNRWRRRRDAAHYDEPLLAHVEGAIKELEHQKWLSRSTLWWYILPIGLGCMIPPVLFFAMDYGKRPLFDSLIALLSHEVAFVATFIFVYLVMNFGRRIGLEQQRQELQALLALRETLLNTDE